jgi:hypothetical protein
MNTMSRRVASRPRLVAPAPRTFHPWAALGQVQLATRQRSARARLFALLITEWAALFLDDPVACVAQEWRPSPPVLEHRPELDITTNAIDGPVLQDATQGVHCAVTASRFHGGGFVGSLKRSS